MYVHKQMEREPGYEATRVLYVLYFWNFTVARFYFKALFDAVIIWGWLDVKGSIYRDRLACNFNNVLINFICTHNKCAPTHITVNPLPCGEVSRVVLTEMTQLKYAVTFRGWWDFEVQRNYEEIYCEYFVWKISFLEKLAVYYLVFMADDILAYKQRKLLIMKTSRSTVPH